MASASPIPTEAAPRSPAHGLCFPVPAEVNVAAAAVAVLGLALMALGCLCVIMVLSKGAESLLRVGAVCFGLSGEGSSLKAEVLQMGGGKV